MIGSRNGRRWPTVDQVVEAYESALAREGRVDLADFLPAADNPEYLAILCELVRVDLEYSWRVGRRNRLDHYRERFPELFSDRRWVQEIAFEEFRLRRQAGEDPSPIEYRRRFGAATLDWPSSFLDSLDGDADALAPGSPLPSGDEIVPGLVTAATAYREYRGNQTGDPADLVALFSSRRIPSEPAELFEDLDRSDPKAADRLASAVVSFPEAGSTFLGFRLECELGRGAFGRVYLARQGDLANRPVALKISTDALGETHTLAQLQHTNIVPVYSIHRSGPLHAVCMPYLGFSTLADVLNELKQHPTLPDSGAGLLSTGNRKLPTTDAPPESSEEVDAAEQPSWAGSMVGHSGRVTSQVERLRALGYVQAVLWLAARVADGLAHAHERGILHRDLKPANILLGDDGEPLLLDFNLAADIKLSGRASAALIGGTLPYMAPEILRAFRSGSPTLDPRSDIYSFGVIFYELLTSRHPFEIPSGPVREILCQMIAERLGPIPTLRPWNAKVSPAVESIIGRCLEPDPARRYRSARELHEDLQRQLNDMPLVHTPEPSLRERMGKWSRRHRRLTSLTTVALISAGLLAAVTTGFLVRQRHLARLEAADGFHRLSAEVQQAAALLGSRGADPLQVDEGIEVTRRALSRFGVLDDHDWAERQSVRILPDDARTQLRQEIGHLLLLFARTVAWQAETTTDLPQRSERVHFAVRLNALANACLGETAPSRTLLLQQSELARLDGRDGEASRLRREADFVPCRTPMDHYWDIVDRIERRARSDTPLAARERRNITASLQNISQHDPQNFVNYLLIGNCYVRLGELNSAISCYSTGISLRPDLPWAYVNRGLAHLEIHDYSAAIADFDRVIALRADMVEAYINRALARIGVGDFSAAVADLDHALEHPDTPVRALFIRARAKERLGDREGAAQDRTEGLRRKPKDELSWIVRGLARLENDPNAALADFDAALSLNPRSKSALQNKAHVLGERLGRTEDAVKVLGTAIRYYPDDANATGARGVYHGRIGRRDAALADARAALAQSDQSFTVYQVAGIYALTSRQHPEDRREALRLLAIALRKDASWFQVLPSDHDLDPIRDQPEFQELIRAVAVVDQVTTPAQPVSTFKQN
jgi:eukaryotic-like serine/threonine-protein kinase